MNIYNPVSVKDIDVHNAIKTLGCNILLWSGVGNIAWESNRVPAKAKKYLEEVKKQLINKVLAKDGDYGQVAILNFGHTTFFDGLEEVMREVFTVMFVSKIKGGHGNSDCTLVVLDLSKLREEAGIEVNYPDEDEEEPEEDDEDDNA